MYQNSFNWMGMKGGEMVSTSILPAVPSNMVATSFMGLFKFTLVKKN